jgi:hypothetical protein
MIKRLNQHNLTDVCEFVSRVKDTYEDFYVTTNKQRVFLKDLKLIKKILNNQEVIGLENSGELKAILIIYREKTFRPYVRVLAEKNDYIYDLMKYLNWNYNCELFIKFKKTNPLSKIAQKFFFNFIGDRGTEILLAKKKREIKNDKPSNQA